MKSVKEKKVTSKLISLIILCSIIISGTKNSLKAQDLNLDFTETFSCKLGNFKIQGIRGKNKNGIQEQVVSFDSPKFYDDQNIIPDIFSSFKMIDNTSVKDLIKTGAAFFVKIGKNENNVNNGLQVLRYYYPDYSDGNNNWAYGFVEIARGNYLDNKIAGKMNIDLFSNTNYRASKAEKIITETSGYFKNIFYFSMPEKENPLKSVVKLQMEFDNDALTDQTINFNYNYSYYDEHIGTFYWQPFITIKNRKIITVCKENQEAKGNTSFIHLPSTIVSIKGESYIFNYTSNPSCFNEYSNLNDYNLKLEVYKSNKNVIGLLNTNGVKENNINGDYKLYKYVQGKLNDTTILKASFSYYNGVKNGEAFIWDKDEDKLIYRLNFLNDKLNGVSEMYYKTSGKLNVSVQYIDGMPKHIDSYWDVDCCPLFIPKYVIEPMSSLINQNVVYLLSLMDLGEYNDRISAAGAGFFIDDYINKGFKMEKPKGYFKFCSIDYRIEGNKSIVSSPITFFSSANTKLHIKFFDRDGNETNYVTYDKLGSLVTSKSKDINELNKEIAEANRVYELEQSKTIQCYYCGKDVVLKNSITIDEINCGNRVEIVSSSIFGGVKHFCSRKCSEEYQCVKCKQEGYPCNR